MTGRTAYTVAKQTQYWMAGNLLFITHFPNLLAEFVPSATP